MQIKKHLIGIELYKIFWRPSRESWFHEKGLVKFLFCIFVMVKILN